MLKLDCEIEYFDRDGVSFIIRPSYDVETGLKYLANRQLVMTLEEKQDVRTLAMNDCMHWYCRLIAKHQHENFDDVKIRCKVMFGAMMNHDGQLVPKPTSQYSIKETIDFIDRLDAHCRIDLGIDVNPSTEMFECHQEWKRTKEEEDDNIL